MKEKSYDPYTGVSTLQAAWVSRASEKQRRGRAGRCQPGVAFHCYSRTRSQALAELQLPELKRSPLDELCLQVQLPPFHMHQYRPCVPRHGQRSCLCMALALPYTLRCMFNTDVVLLPWALLERTLPDGGPAHELFLGFDTT